ncbi:hypothetical protein N4R57_08500 [Rhodobacteraceae bacterium D3-12]|nr:hypothetical protein N4R57_08500 [Rhodobacteraceae bacterium D3-12]
MSKSNKTPDTAANPKVATAATETTAMRLNNVALIGTFGSADAPGALIRLPAGKILKVSTGDQTTIGKVVGISQSELLLAKGGRTLRLAMPR